MGVQSLLDTIASAFWKEEQEGDLVVDQIGLAAAYPGLVPDSYVLGVSAPSLANSENCYDKSDRIIDVLFARLTPEERSHIDRVRVYNSRSELEQHIQCGFEDGFYGYCEAPVQQTHTRAVTTPA